MNYWQRYGNDSLIIFQLFGLTINDVVLIYSLLKEMHCEKKFDFDFLKEYLMISLIEFVAEKKNDDIELKKYKNDIKLVLTIIEEKLHIVDEQKQEILDLKKQIKKQNETIISLQANLEGIHNKMISLLDQKINSISIQQQKGQDEMKYQFDQRIQSLTEQQNKKQNEMQNQFDQKM